MLRRIALTLALLACAPATAHAADFDVWSPAGSPAIDRNVPTAVALADGRALLVGGGVPDSHGSYAPVASAELYDPLTNVWTPAAPMSTPRQGATATVLRDGRVLVAGGTVKAGYWDTKSAELYDPATNTWAPAADMGHPRMFHHAVALADGRVLVLGRAATGEDASETRSAEIYDPAANQWSPAAPMSLLRGGAAVSRLRDGRVLVAGGVDSEAFQRGEQNIELASAEVYDPATDHWTATGPMTEPRYESGVAALPDGRALVAGGWRWWDGLAYGAEFDKKTAELLDPKTLTWSPTGSLSVGRGEGATMVSTAGGVPVFIGGLVGSNNGGWEYSQGSVEAYDAATGTWSFMPAMASHRNGHTALTLANGMLLVFGGNPFPAGSERFIPQPPPVVSARPAPAPTPAPAAPQVIAGKFSFARPLPNRLKTNKLQVRMRCTGGPCRDRLVLREGKRTLARRDIRAGAGATVTVKLTLTASTRRKLRHRTTAAMLALSDQSLKRWVTLVG